MKMNKVKLDDIVSIRTGRLNANAAEDGGKYPFFTTAEKVSRINSYSYEGEVVLVAGNGDLNVKYYNGKFDAYQRTYILSNKDEEKLDMKYLYYFMSIYVERLRNEAIGGVIKYIKKSNLTEAKVPLPDLDTQKEIITILEKSETIINKRTNQVQELDNLIRSIFFETIDNINYENISFGDAFDLIDGDRGKNYPKKSDFTNNGYCLFLNTKNVTKKGFSFEETEFISKEKDEVLRSGKVEYGDFILTTRGTVGNVTYYNEKIPYENIRINSGMLILRPKIEIDERYFQILIRELPILELAISGSAQPQLPKGRLIELEFPIIDQNKQVLFSEKVKEIESVKAKMEESLNEMKTLFDALMQKAFTGELV